MTEESLESIVYRNPVQKVGFAQLSHVIALDPDLSDGAYRTYAIYLKYAQQKGECFPGTERLASDRKKKRVTVSRHTTELVRLGYITRVRRLGTSSMTYIEDVNQIPRLVELGLVELAKQNDTTIRIINDTTECISEDTVNVSKPLPKEEQGKDNKVKNKTLGASAPAQDSCPIEISEPTVPVTDSEVLEQAVPKPRIDAKPPRPPAVDVYREVTELFPPKSWWPDLAEVTDLDRWREVVRAYVGLGWYKGNVKYMLEKWYNIGEIPHVRGVKRNAPSRIKHEQASPSVARAIAAQHSKIRRAPGVEETRAGPGPKG